MSSDTNQPFDETEPFRSFFDNPFFNMQGEAMKAMFSGSLPGGGRCGFQPGGT